MKSFFKKMIFSKIFFGVWLVRKKSPTVKNGIRQLLPESGRRHWILANQIPASLAKFRPERQGSSQFGQNGRILAIL
jgi:hypothetical protein